MGAAQASVPWSVYLGARPALAGRRAVNSERARAQCASTGAAPTKLFFRAQEARELFDDRANAVAGGGAHQVELLADLTETLAQRLEGLAHLGEVRFAEGDDLGALRQLGIEVLELTTNHQVILEGFAPFAGIQG